LYQNARDNNRIKFAIVSLGSARYERMLRYYNGSGPIFPA
jgi:hypothetical protein